MQFLGWKLSTGETVTTTFYLKDENDVITETIHLGQHEAHIYRKLSGYKGKMTPQYNRAG